MTAPEQKPQPKPMEAVMARFGGRLGFILLALFLFVFGAVGLHVPLGDLAQIQYWLAFAAALCLLFNV